MGKVKVKVLGDENLEQEALAEQKKKREQKAAEKAKNSDDQNPEEATSETKIKTETSKQTKKSKKSRARARSTRHNENKTQIAVKTTYPISNAVEILRKFKTSKFDETVELHINVREKGVNGSVALPHGTGKTLRIMIADDDIIADVERGKINFDILVAQPAMMPKLAKVAKILGPRGLMPNPKSGTITDKPEEAVKKLAAGQISYKTESGGPIIHMSIGKVSFKDSQIEENIKAVLTSIGASKITTATLKSTMSPGIKIQV